VETSWIALTDFFQGTSRLLKSSPATDSVGRWSVGFAAPPRTSTVSRLCRLTGRGARRRRLRGRPLSPLRPSLHLLRWLLRLPRMTRSCRSEGRDHWRHVELQVFRSSPDWRSLYLGVRQGYRGASRPHPEYSVTSDCGSPTGLPFHGGREVRTAVRDDHSRCGNVGSRTPVYEATGEVRSPWRLQVEG